MERLEPEVPRPQPMSPESVALQEAEEEAGEAGAFLFFRRLRRDGDGLARDEAGVLVAEFEIAHLGGDKVDVGHHPHCELVIDWDPAIARAHAELERSGADWYVDNLDEGSGTWVNGVRVEERMLVDGDELRFGDTILVFRQPGLARPVPPVRPLGEEPPALTEAQRKVLVALVAPLMGSEPDAEPADNAAICEELTLAEDTVKGHLKSLFKIFGVADLKPFEKRKALALRARETGAVTRGDYS